MRGYALGLVRWVWRRCSAFGYVTANSCITRHTSLTHNIQSQRRINPTCYQTPGVGILGYSATSGAHTPEAPCITVESSGEGAGVVDAYEDCLVEEALLLFDRRHYGAGCEWPCGGDGVLGGGYQMRTVGGLPPSSCLRRAWSSIVHQRGPPFQSAVWHQHDLQRRCAIRRCGLRATIAALGPTRRHV